MAYTVSTSPLVPIANPYRTITLSENPMDEFFSVTTSKSTENNMLTKTWWNLAGFYTNTICSGSGLKRRCRIAITTNLNSTYTVATTTNKGTVASSSLVSTNVWVTSTLYRTDTTTYYRTDTTTYYRTDTLYGGYRALYRIDTTTYYRTDTTTYYGTFTDKNTSVNGRAYFTTSYKME